MRRLMGVFDKGDTKGLGAGLRYQHRVPQRLEKTGKQQVIALFMAPKSSNVGMFAPNVNITVENLEERR